MKRSTGILVLVLAFAVTSASAQTVRERLHAAQSAAGAKNFPEALAIYQALIDDATVSREDKAASWARVIEIHRQQKKFDDAVAAGRQLLELQTDDARRKLGMLQIADLYMQGSKAADAVQVLKDLAGKYPDDDDIFIQTNLLAGTYLVRDKKNAAAVEFYDAAAKRMDADDPRRIDAIWSTASALWDSEQIDKSIEVTKQLLDPKFRTHPRLSTWQANDRVIGGLVKLKQQPEAVALLKEWEQTDPDIDLRARWCLGAARNAVWSGDAEGGLESYKRLLLNHAAVGSSEGWFEAQSAIVDGLVRKNDLPAALKAAHILFDAALDQGAVTSAVQKMADLLNKIDGNNKRAKALVNYQLFGPAGRDGKPGTPDDETNILPEIGYPDDPERFAAFAKAFANVGDDASATFHRGQLCLYVGQPAAAVGFYLEAIRRSDLEQWPTFVSAAVMSGWRPLNGHGLGIDAAATYFLTGDENANPFKDMKIAPSPWTLPAPSTEEVDQLESTRVSLWNIAEDPGFPPQLRRAALRGILRIAEVTPTDDMERLLVLTREPDGQLREAAIWLVLKAARGDALSIAPVRAFLATDRLPANALKKADADVNRIAKMIEKLTAKNAGVPKLQPVK